MRNTLWQCGTPWDNVEHHGTILNTMEQRETPGIIFKLSLRSLMKLISLKSRNDLQARLKSYMFSIVPEPIEEL